MKYYLSILINFLLLIKISNAQLVNANELKAEYLLNLEKSICISWPEDDLRKNFVIGIFSTRDPKSNPVALFLEKKVKAKNINRTSKLVIKYIDKISENGFNDCKMIFIINETERSKLSEIIKYTKTKHILTVGDNINDFCILGGHINITLESEKQFQINIANMDLSQLRASPGFIYLCERIKESKR